MARKISKHRWRWPVWHRPRVSAPSRAPRTSCRASITTSGLQSARLLRGYVRVFLEAGIPIRLVTGADVHIAADLDVQLGNGRALTLNDSRYLLLEPPHHQLPRRLPDLIFGLQAAGYVPIVTHPERLSWIEGHYDLVKRLVRNSVLMQITAGSLMGRFGRRPTLLGRTHAR